MKSKLLLAALLAPIVATAGFNVPSKVYDIADLEKAKAEAKEKGKPISILWSNKETTCPLCANASATIIKELGNKTVMVYTNDANKLPDLAKKEMMAGRAIPKVTVADVTLTKSLGTVGYEAIEADPRKAFRDVERAIRDYKK